MREATLRDNLELIHFDFDGTVSTRRFAYSGDSIESFGPNFDCRVPSPADSLLRGRKGGPWMVILYRAWLAARLPQYVELVRAGTICASAATESVVRLRPNGLFVFDGIGTLLHEP